MQDISASRSESPTCATSTPTSRRNSVDAFATKSSTGATSSDDAPDTGIGLRREKRTRKSVVGTRLYDEYQNDASYNNKKAPPGQKIGYRHEKSKKRAKGICDTSGKSQNKKRGMQSTTATPPHSHSVGLGPIQNQAESHYLCDHLSMTRSQILESLPPKTVEMFNDCAWAKWKQSFRPVLILSPFDLSGNDAVVVEYLDMYIDCRDKGKLTQSDAVSVLVYWYEKGWSNSRGFTAFSMVKPSDLISYDEGLGRGYDKQLRKQLNDPHTYGTLTPDECGIVRGIKLIQDDAKLDKDSRGGPMFFPHLREKEIRESKKLRDSNNDSFKKRARSARNVSRMSRNTPNFSDASISSDGGNEIREEADTIPADLDAKLSLELCAGEEAMSLSFSVHGFTPTTLDNDMKRSAHSKLSLEQLEGRIMSNQLADHPCLDKNFSVIWAAPECRTWSCAANGIYRNKQFIDGKPCEASYSDAQQAKRDIESLVHILTYYKHRNPSLKICIENPEGYLQHHPVSKLFSSELGLQRINITYCLFTDGNILPKKPTVIWTNSIKLIQTFGDDSFSCKNDCQCMAADGKTHKPSVRDYSDRMAEYPPKMCDMFANLLAAEVRQLQRSSCQKRGNKDKF